MVGRAPTWDTSRSFRDRDTVLDHEPGASVMPQPLPPGRQDRIFSPRLPGAPLQGGVARPQPSASTAGEILPSIRWTCVPSVEQLMVISRSTRPSGNGWSRVCFHWREGGALAEEPSASTGEAWGVQKAPSTPGHPSDSGSTSGPALISRLQRGPFRRPLVPRSCVVWELRSPGVCCRGLRVLRVSQDETDDPRPPHRSGGGGKLAAGSGIRRATLPWRASPEPVHVPTFSTRHIRLSVFLLRRKEVPCIISVEPDP